MSKSSVVILLSFSVLVLWMVFCRRIVEAATPCPEAIEDAALNQLWPRFHDVPNYLSVWISRDYDISQWKPRLDRWQSKITYTRKWASGLPNSCERKAYLGWLDYYQGDLDSAWEELRTKKEKREMDAYERMSATTLESVARLRPHI